MNNEFNNIIKAVQSVKLSENEKVVMKSNVFSSVISSEISSVTNSIPSRLNYQWAIENYINLLIKQKNFMTALILMIMLAATGGTSAIAEKAIPGDALYQVKVSINEPVAGLFNVSEEGNANWQERLVERRLEEAQKVATQGTLSTSTQAEIESNINNQIEKFTKAVKKLSENDNKAVSSSELIVRLESALSAHQNILERAEKEGKISTSTKETARELRSALKENEDEVKNHREEMESTLGDDSRDVNASSTASTTPEYVLNKQAVAEKILANVKTKYQEEKAGLATTTIVEVDKKLAEVEKVLAEGKANVSLGKFDQARKNFQEVIKLSNNIRVNILTDSISKDIENDNDNNKKDVKNEDEDKKDRDSESDKDDNKNSTSSIRKIESEKRDESRSGSKVEDIESKKEVSDVSNKENNDVSKKVEKLEAENN